MPKKWKKTNKFVVFYDLLRIEGVKKLYYLQKQF